MTENRPIYITGPTASGKTGRAVSLARRLDAEIVSADSRQVFRRMNLGTGKDLEEYGDVAYHLIDVVEPGEPYNLFRFLADANSALDDIERRGRQAVVCGGSGMYVEALARGTRLPEVPPDPELRRGLRGESLETLTGILAGMKALHNTTDTDTVARAIRAIEIETYYAAHPELKPEPLSHTPLRQPLIVGVEIDREMRRSRISSRLHSRLDSGMVDEVAALLAEGVSPDTLIGYGLEYRFITLHLIGRLTLDEMITQLEIAIHQFAKRQMTWFRGMERRGLTLHWLPFDMPEDEFVDRVVSLHKEYYDGV